MSLSNLRMIEGKLYSFSKERVNAINEATNGVFFNEYDHLDKIKSIISQTVAILDYKNEDIFAVYEFIFDKLSSIIQTAKELSIDIKLYDNFSSSKELESIRKLALLNMGDIKRNNLFNVNITLEKFNIFRDSEFRSNSLASIIKDIKKEDLLNIELDRSLGKYDWEGNTLYSRYNISSVAELIYILNKPEFFKRDKVASCYTTNVKELIGNTENYNTLERCREEAPPFEVLNNLYHILTIIRDIRNDMDLNTENVFAAEKYLEGLEKILVMTIVPLIFTVGNGLNGIMEYFAMKDAVQKLKKEIETMYK